jgi:hypothetical protein
VSILHPPNPRTPSQENREFSAVTHSDKSAHTSQKTKFHGVINSTPFYPLINRKNLRADARMRGYARGRAQAHFKKKAENI